jgi:hypothetical protein
MDLFHPRQSLCDLNVQLWGEGIRIIQRCYLDIDDSRQERFVPVKKARTTYWAKTTHCRSGRVKRRRIARCYTHILLSIGRPGHHRRASTSPAIAAMTQRLIFRRSGEFIPYIPTMASACQLHPPLLSCVKLILVRNLNQIVRK